MMKEGQRGKLDLKLIALCGFLIIVGWQIYNHVFLQKIEVGPLSATFENSKKVAIAAPPVRQFSLTGVWHYTGRSSVTGLGCTRSIQITMEGNQVSGVMSPCDDSMSGVEGIFNGKTLKLSRDTGKNATQTVLLTKQSDDRFEGIYWNVGTTKDEGSFVIWR